MQGGFSVIKGGRDIKDKSKYHRFISGVATDTRLMGVVGLELRWKVWDSAPGESSARPETLKQIFYLDCESRFIDSYTECYGQDDADIRRERMRLVSALGGNLVPVTEKEARFLVQSYCDYDGNGQLPEGGSSYTFLLSPEQTLTQDEYDSLAGRICCEIPSANFAVNYYLMRCASLDQRGSAYMRGDTRFADPDHIRPADMPARSCEDVFGTLSTLCVNKVGHDEENPHTYTSESLTERFDGYYITHTSATVTDWPCRISGITVNSDFRVTDIEAAMIMRRPEYIAVCSVPYSDPYFHPSFAAFTAAFTETRYDYGRLFIQFRSNNNHVGNAVYRLNDDIQCMYFMTANDQIVIMAYSADDASLAEINLIASLLRCDIYTEIRYEFPEPVMYEFINSGFDNFMEFLDYIREDGDE